jgi:hypothetical protein
VEAEAALVVWFLQAGVLEEAVDFQLVAVALLVHQAKEITAAVMRTPQILTVVGAAAVLVQLVEMLAQDFQVLVAQALPLQLLAHQ